MCHAGSRARVFAFRAVAILLLATGACKKGDVSEKTSPAQSNAAKPAPEATVGKTAPTPAPVGLPEASADLMIQPEVGLGKLRFGMTMNEAKDILGEPASTVGNAYQYAAGFGVAPGRDGSVAVLMFGGLPDSTNPMVGACKHRTTKGIGMGSTEEEVVRAYGPPSQQAWENLGNKQLTTMKYADLSAEFTLCNGRVVHMTFKRKS